jgi:very-short-patch-repair endonuclease
VSLGLLAGEQHGVVARRQMYALGLTANQVQARVRSGRLVRLHRGVYAVGHDRLSARGRWLAAVLACGPEAVLSHRAALALWDLCPIPGGWIDVTIPGRGGRGQRGIRGHSVRALRPADRTVVDGIPVTSLARTLLDYAEIARFQQLRLVLEEAIRREVLDGRKLDETLARAWGRHGLKPLRAALTAIRGPVPWTQSRLEREFLALVRSAGLPEPSANVVVQGFLVDLFWAEARVAAEIDSYGFHKTRQKFEDDRRQDTKLLLAGVPTVRVTQARIENEPEQLIGDVALLLSRAPRRAGAGA